MVDLPMITPESKVTHCDGGNLLVENAIELAAYPDNLVIWLRSSAQNFPNKPFLQQRNSVDTIAKIQFTSGSTNLRKGVEVTHEMMAANQMSIHQAWPLFLAVDCKTHSVLPD